MSESNPRCGCDGCGHEDFRDSLPPAKDLFERIEFGGVYTDRECPECHALCYPIQPTVPLRAAIIEILEARGEGLLGDDGVDSRVAGEIADDIITLMPDQESEEPVAFGFNYHDMFEQANRNGLALTRQEARDLIERLNSKGDASTGVSCDTINYWMGEMKIGRLLTGEEIMMFESTGEAITQS